MRGILSDIKRLRGQNEINIDRNNNHRHRVIVDEKDGTKTAYYFSSPIYNIHTKKLVDFRFNSINDMFVLEGTNSKIVVDENIDIIGLSGSCRIRANGKPIAMNEQEIAYDSYSILPTSNGIAYRAKVNKGQSFRLELEVTHPFLKIVANDRCFALMIDEFVPLLTISSIGTLDEGNRVIDAAIIDYTKIDDRKYIVSISTQSVSGRNVLFEVNMYERKLIQDTTVESKNPSLNNAFGSTAFLGLTEKYGEQWLYIRPLFSYLSELLEQRDKRVRLHFPIQGGEDKDVAADLFMIGSRFCSFGSNWENKINETSRIACGVLGNNYLSFDITNYVRLLGKSFFSNLNGMLIEPRTEMKNAIAIPTGDSYSCFPIIEINYI